MRINLPVTDVEYPIDETVSIVSKTDLKGAITYASEDFVKVSGFTREEMLGKSHNIVRHPDVPPEYFADMWQSLKEERPWTGVVKNRRKNGDFYWLLNNVAPFYENDQLVGYMSVRLKASPAQIAAANHAYQLFRDGKAGKLKVCDGKLVKPSLFSKLYPFTNFTIKARLTFIIGLLSLLMMIIGGMGLRGMSKTNAGLHTVYKDRTVTMGLLFNISELQRENLMLIASALVNPIPEVVQQNAAELDRNILEIGKLWNTYLSNELDSGEKILADNFTESSTRFVRKGLNPAIAALGANDAGLADKIRQEDIRPLYKLANQSIRELMQWQIDAALKVYQEAQSRYQYTRNLAFGLTLLGIALALWLGFTLIRAIVQPLETAIGHFRRIAQGHYNNSIDIVSHDEIGKVMAALKAMQIKCGFDVSETKRIAAEYKRIMVALDNVGTGCMIADSSRRIIYANKAAIAILRKAEADIRRQLPNFSVADLVGSNIDVYHRHPEHQAQLLAALETVHSAGIEVGGRSIALTVRPVINDAGQRLGTVAELSDHTVAEIWEQEVATILHAASRGDFSGRIDTRDKDGFYRQLGEGLNELLAAVENGLQEIRRKLHALSDYSREQSAAEILPAALQHNAAAGAALLEQLRSKMDAINAAAHKVADIVAAIDDVVLQTNMLAHSAAIEATRAGEHGHGFAAVAAAMQQFAQRAGSNAAEINMLLDASLRSAADGRELAARSNQTMKELADSIEQLKVMLAATSAAATQQTDGLEQLNQAISNWQLRENAKTSAGLIDTQEHR